MSHPRDMVTPEEEEAARRPPPTPEQRADRKRRKKTAAMGKREERQVVKRLLAVRAEINAHRVPGSGSFEGTEDADVIADLGDLRIEHEVKARTKSGWVTLDKWKGAADVLVLQEMQQAPGQKKPEPKVFMDWNLYERLLRGYRV